MGDDDRTWDVRLTVDGGFAPLALGPRVIRAAAADLTVADAHQLRLAVDGAVAASPSEGGERLSGMPDVMVYRLEAPRGTLVFDDVTATPEEHELVALISALARQ